MEYPNRKSIRLQAYDYSAPGAYFVTICTKDKRKILGDVVGGGLQTRLPLSFGHLPRTARESSLDAPHVQLTGIGKIVDQYIRSTNNIPAITVDKYVVMPNHIHMLVSITGGTSRAPSPTNAMIPHMVSTFKRFCNAEIGHNIFQRSYHDHIIRDQRDYDDIWRYIDENPAKWNEDEFFVE